MSAKKPQPLDEIAQMRQQIARELGQQRVRSALRKIEDAKGLLDGALSDLSTLLGSIPTYTAGCKVSDRIHAYYYRVAALRDRLAEKGGARVDSDHVDAELKRRGAP